MPDIQGILTGFLNSLPVQLGLRFALAYFAALYLAMVFWTVRDMQERSENPALPYLAGLLVVGLNVLGLFIYLIVRPRSTVVEAYEARLAQEALIVEAEKHLSCSTCFSSVEPDYTLCPTCQTTLKITCTSCRRLMALEWERCAYCKAPTVKMAPAPTLKPV